MAVFLIRSDGKHISATQLAMADDRVLEGFIHRMEKPVIPEIHDHLQVVGFLHVSHMSGCCKLDLQLINALRYNSVCRWTGIIMGLAIVLGKVTLCQSLLGKVPNNFEGGRILMNWLKDNFNELPKDLEDRTEEETKLEICHIVHVISGDVSGHATECGVDQWLSAPIAIVGLVATTIAMSQGD
ncbi:hypothetical protein Goari_011362 [Gossypium aridum]|uniref:Uncharacterized protein n=1 Tax=Gossypium aridum TaxID=34290 RepID=A0A7J8WXE5_GOSAI|nr:hypothetical protein [Gossypium aridum]